MISPGFSFRNTEYKMNGKTLEIWFSRFLLRPFQSQCKLRKPTLILIVIYGQVQFSEVLAHDFQGRPHK